MTERQPGVSDETLALLRAPFVPAAIKFKIQSGGGSEQDPKRAVIAAYIDARLVIERLNLAAGFDWSDTYEHASTFTTCRLTVKGVTRVDVGEYGEGPMGKSQKTVTSDALKRAAVKFGIGVSIYASPTLYSARGDLWYTTRDGKSRPGGIKDDAIKSYRKQYGDWLAASGEAMFGKAIDHGDAEQSAGDMEIDHAEAPNGEAPAAPVSGDARLASQEQIARFYAIAPENAYCQAGLRMDPQRTLAESLRDLAGWVTREGERGPVTSLHNLTRDEYQQVSRVMEAMGKSPESAARVVDAVTEWVAMRSAQGAIPA